MTNKITYRQAEKGDSALILQFVKELAEYEKEPDAVVATVDDIKRTMFDETPRAFGTIAELDGEPVGFCLCFYTYSTWQGKAGLYIEDLYVQEQHRGKGIGKGFFKHLAQKAVEEDYGRIQWSVLDWNQPSIDFYEGLGAKPLSEWISYRLEGDIIQQIANKESNDDSTEAA